MIYDIRDRHPSMDSETRNDMTSAANLMTYNIEDLVEQGIQIGVQPDVAALNRFLSQIQSKLRSIHVGNGARREPGED